MADTNVQLNYKVIMIKLQQNTYSYRQLQESLPFPLALLQRGGLGSKRSKYYCENYTL